MTAGAVQLKVTQHTDFEPIVSGVTVLLLSDSLYNRQCNITFTLPIVGPLLQRAVRPGIPRISTLSVASDLRCNRFITANMVRTKMTGVKKIFKKWTKMVHCA